MKYWGLGIENETYFEASSIMRSGKYIKQNKRRERYSVDYSTCFQADKLNQVLDKMFADENMYHIPIYVNSHTFTKTDINGEHATIYSYDRRPNPKYNGKSLHEIMMENDFFAKDYEKKYVFDGDTIEFITQKFYCVTVKDCVRELSNYKTKFIKKLNKLFKKNNIYSLKYPDINYGLVHFKTNPYNLTPFNNGTYHVNITLPSKIDKNGILLNMEEFTDVHRNAIKVLQWMEPILIAIYGSPDIYSIASNKYSSGSLRLTSSRYVSIGTYNSDEMKCGKLLQDAKSNHHIYNYSQSWYNKIGDITDYHQGDVIGYDINYAKHHQSGIEFRILDYFPETALSDFINIIILLMDHSLENKIDINAYESQHWHDLVTHVLIKGYTSKISRDIQYWYHKILKFPIFDNENITDYLINLVEYLYSKYRNSMCSKLMSPKMKHPKIYNVNRYMWENNYLQYIPINSCMDNISAIYGTEIDSEKVNNLIQHIEFDDQKIRKYIPLEKFIMSAAL